MTTSIRTHNPARSAAAAVQGATTAPRGKPRGWAVAGLGAGLGGIATIVTSSLVDTVYQPKFSGRSTASPSRWARRRR